MTVRVRSDATSDVEGVVVVDVEDEVDEEVVEVDEEDEGEVVGMRLSGICRSWRRMVA